MTRKSTKQILFVCTGNTCRSPMAEYLFRQMCEKEKIRIKIISRGVDLKQPPTKMNIEAEEALKRHSKDIKDIARHVSKPVSRKDLSESDMILVMSPSHKEKIIEYANDKIKDLDKKVFTLKSLQGKEGEIKDPYTKVLNPLYRLFRNFVPKRFKHLPNFWPFNKYKDYVYDSCRDEILENLDALLNILKA